jgi:hypothetical protein
MEDVKLQILLQASYPDIVNLCAVDQSYNKVCNKNVLWEQLIQRDFPFMPIVSPKQDYIKAYTLFNNYTLYTIKELLDHHVLYSNLQDLYDEVFDTLVVFIRALFYNTEVIEDYTVYYNTVENETYTILRGVLKRKTLGYIRILDKFYHDYNKKFFNSKYQPP